MVVRKEEVMEQLSRVLTIIPQKYIEALLALLARLEGTDIEWAVGGDLGEMLRTIKVTPEAIEILTSREGAQKIAQTVKELNPGRVNLQTQELPRKAKVGEKEFTVYTRSHSFDFKIDSVSVKVYGDLQYKINSWDWGDKIEFTPEYVTIVGKRIAVVPLSLKYELYQMLGWTDRAEKIKVVLDRRNPQRS